MLPKVIGPPEQTFPYSPNDNDNSDDSSHLNGTWHVLGPALSTFCIF